MKRKPEIIERLDRIETMLASLVNKEPPKEFYSTSEVAQILGKAEFTVREWCRNGRVLADKRQCGRGLAKEWIISHQELQRIQSEGLIRVN